tara:strand:+ start:10367 stop:11125 length:759 start_codon:yes stop_codon:yes gene_type:complete
MKKCIFISVRSDSTRLPNKATRLLFNKPTIQYLIDNLKNSEKADDIVLCTTQLESDDVLCAIAEKSGIKCFRGSSEDKLARWLGACEEFGIDFFVNADGDDLFFDCALADHVIEQWTVSRPDFLDGHGLYYDVYGITKEALKKVCEIKGTDETEYIRPYFTDTGHFEVHRLKVPQKYKKTDARMTLDYLDDLNFFEAVIRELRRDELPITFDNVLELLKNKPDLKRINNYLEGEWKENQEKIKKLILKSDVK